MNNVDEGGNTGTDDDGGGGIETPSARKKKEFGLILSLCMNGFGIRDEDVQQLSRLNN